MKIPLETQRFFIRRFEPDDLPSFLNFILDEVSTRYLMFEAEQKTEDGAIALFEFVRSAYDSPEPINSYAIAEKETNRYLGSCGYAPYDEGIYECYYSVNRAETGQGIATEAIAALVKELSNEAEVRAYCHPENHAAHSVAKKCGFTPMGMQTHQHFGNQGELFIFRRRSASNGGLT